MTQTIDDVYAAALRLARIHRLTRGLATQDQEDIAHEAVADYLGAFGDGEGPRNAEAWLEVAVRNEATDFLRRRRRREEHEGPPARLDPEESEVEDVLAALRTLSTPSLWPVRRDLLGRILALLPPAAAEAIRLRFVDGLDAATVAEQLGIGRAAVDQRVSRAKRQLRDALAARPDLADELRLGHPRPYDLS